MKLKNFEEIETKGQFKFYRYCNPYRDTYNFDIECINEFKEVLDEVVSMERQFVIKNSKLKTFFIKENKINLLEIQKRFESVMYKFIWSKLITEFTYEDIVISLNVKKSGIREYIGTYNAYLTFNKEIESNKASDIMDFVEKEINKILENAISDFMGIYPAIRMGHIPLMEHKNTIMLDSNLMYESSFEVYTDRITYNVYSVDAELEEYFDTNSDIKLMKTYDIDTKLLKARTMFDCFNYKGFITDFDSLNYKAKEFFKTRNLIKDEEPILKITSNRIIDEDGEINLKTFLKLKKKYEKRFHGTALSSLMKSVTELEEEC